MMRLRRTLAMASPGQQNSILMNFTLPVLRSIDPVNADLVMDALFEQDKSEVIDMLSDETRTKMKQLIANVKDRVQRHAQELALQNQQAEISVLPHNEINTARLVAQCLNAALITAEDKAAFLIAQCQQSFADKQALTSESREAIAKAETAREHELKAEHNAIRILQGEKTAAEEKTRNVECNVEELKKEATAQHWHDFQNQKAEAEARRKHELDNQKAEAEALHKQKTQKLKEEADSFREQRLKQQRAVGEKVKADELATQRSLAEENHKLLMQQKDARAKAEIDKNKRDDAVETANLKQQLASLRQQLVVQNEPTAVAPPPVDNNNAFQANVEMHLMRQSEAMRQRMESFAESSQKSMMAMFEK